MEEYKEKYKLSGLIFLGYQGIGKSTIGGKHNCIDLESSIFSQRRDVNPDWYIDYCELAIHLANQGYTVLMSTHVEVRKTLNYMIKKPYHYRVICIVPDLSLRNAWIDKLIDRFQLNKELKDFRALHNAVYMYESNTTDILNQAKRFHFSYGVIENMNYDFEETILGFQQLYLNDFTNSGNIPFEEVQGGPFKIKIDVE